ncbi:MAG: hypothetical protein V3T17_07330 [Pseudomonadales bacterium]
MSLKIVGSLKNVAFPWFPKDSNLYSDVAQSEIEVKASEIAKQAVGEDITARQEKKVERIKSYIDDEAPWHRDILKDIDLSTMPYNPSSEEIEARLQKEKHKQEVSIRREVTALLEDSNTDNLKESVGEIVSKISENGKNDLTHYIASRRHVLKIFRKSLELDPDGKYSSEGVVHDIIFLRHGGTEKRLSRITIYG